MGDMCKIAGRSLLTLVAAAGVICIIVLVAGAMGYL